MIVAGIVTVRVLKNAFAIPSRLDWIKQHHLDSFANVNSGGVVAVDKNAVTAARAVNFLG